MEVPGKSRNKDLEEVDAVLCQPCQERNQSTRSNGFCTQCREHMCVNCFETHKQFKVSRGHSLVDGNDASVTVEQNEVLQKCDQHFNELVKFYCPVHEQVGCGDCMILEHKVCKVEYIRDKAREFADSLEFKGLVNDADKCLSQCKETATSIKNNKVQVSDISEKFIKDVEMFSESLISQINKMKTSMIKQAIMIKSKDLETLEKLEKENEVLMEDISSLAELLKSQTEQPSKLFVSYVIKKSRLKQLIESHLKMEKQNSIQNYQFNRNCNLEQAVKETRELGSLRQIKLEHEETVEQRMELDQELREIEKLWIDEEKQRIERLKQWNSKLEQRMELAYPPPPPVQGRPRPSQEPVVLMPTRNQPLDSYKLLCRNVKVDGEYLSYVDNGKRDVGLFVFQNTSALEIEIIKKGQRGTIAVGGVPKNYPENSQPGWKDGSIGYHADDGNLYHERGFGKTFGPKCGDGDRMGIKLMTQLFGNCVVFSRNSDRIGKNILCDSFKMFPAIGFHSPGEVVKVIMGSMRA